MFLKTLGSIACKYLNLLVRRGVTTWVARLTVHHETFIDLRIARSVYFESEVFKDVILLEAVADYCQ